MGVMFTPRMQTASRIADRVDRDTRKKARADHLFEGLGFRASVCPCKLLFPFCPEWNLCRKTWVISQLDGLLR
jgi:hypothetical protein